MINKNTTNILEVGTYAGQVTVLLAAAANEKSSSVNVISIDENNDTFSPTAQESLKIRKAPIFIDLNLTILVWIRLPI